MPVKKICDLEEEFDKEVRLLCLRIATETSCKMERLTRLFTSHGAVYAAKIMLREKKDITQAFLRLWKLRRLDLTIESLVIRKPWRDLFTEGELRIAANRLLDLGYNLGSFPNFLNGPGPLR